MAVTRLCRRVDRGAGDRIRHDQVLYQPV
jgi:hypothetical protein